jgi:DNA-binding protein YbaB
VDTLEDLVLTAIKDACIKAQELGQKKMTAITANLQLPPGMGF